MSLVPHDVILEPVSPFAISVDRERHVTPSLDHVPGSTLRGALATAWRRRHGEDEAFARIFLSGRNRFPFCWPCRGGRVRPAPRSARTCRRHGGLGDGRHRDRHGVFDELLLLARDQRAAECPRCSARLAPYTGLLPAEDGARVVDVLRAVRMHVGIDRTRAGARKGILFGHEVMLPATAGGNDESGALELRGRAWFDAKDAEALAELAEIEGEILVGRSRSSGLGRMKVTLRRREPDLREDLSRRLGRWRDVEKTSARGTTCAFTLATPAILLDDALRWSFDLAAGIGRRLGVSARVRAQRVATGVVRGWSLGGGISRTAEPAVAEGSIVLLDLDAEPDELIPGLIELERDGIGSRRDEGFGELVVADVEPITRSLAKAVGQGV